MNTKANSISTQDVVVLPLPPQMSGADDDMAVYARFMRHLRHVPNSRMEIKVLSALQFTADMTDHSDAHVSKLLVDLGLRAPRMAFPADFLRFADAALMRSGWEVGGPTAGLTELKQFWNAIGEDKFAAFQGEFPLLDERIYL
jgi:hypothetical protein